MAFNPYTIPVPTFIGTCTNHLTDDGVPECSVTDVIEVSVSQNGDTKQVLGTLCREHAIAWYDSHVKVID